MTPLKNYHNLLLISSLLFSLNFLVANSNNDRAVFEGPINGDVDVKNDNSEHIQENLNLEKPYFNRIGGIYDVDLDSLGSEELYKVALMHINSEKEYVHLLNRPLSLQAQIVNGVKYLATLEIAKTNCDKADNKQRFMKFEGCSLDSSVNPLICRIHFFAEAGKPQRNIYKNNCTISQQFEDTLHTNFDTDVTKKPQQLNAERLANLESQILTEESVQAHGPVIDETYVVEPTNVENLNVVPLNYQEPRPQFVTTLYASLPVVDYLPRSYEHLRFVPNFEEKVKRAVDVDSSSSEESKLSASSSSSSSSSQESHSKCDSSSSEEKPPGNFNNQIADLQREKRSLSQMEKVPLEEKNVVRDLAEFAAISLDNMDEDQSKGVILQILGAKKLKLDGIYYQIILRLGISHCNENEYFPYCREKLFTNATKICKVQVHVDEDYLNPRLVKSQCQNIKKDEFNRNRSNYSRYKRHTLVGGLGNKDVNDPEIQKFVKATLEHLDAESNQTKSHKAVEVISAQSQVVAGIRYVIQVKIGLSNCGDEKSDQENSSRKNCEIVDSSPERICSIDVWDRPWLKKTVIKLKCDDDNEESKFELKNK